MSLVAVAAIGVMGIDPAAVATPGFQLSFGAVLGLVLWAAPPWLSRFDKAPRIVRWAVQGLWVTVVATAGTLPASGWWFQAVSPLSPLANLIALPWVAWVVVPMAFAMTWLPEPWSVWAGDVGGWSVDMLVWVLQPLATEPWIVAFGPWVSAAACAWLAMPKSLKWLGLVLCLLSGTRSVKPDETVITFLDVGQGDATLIEWSGGETWLVDGGGRRQQVLQYLRRRGVFSLDVVVASHGHPDHIRGLEAVVGELDVAELWIADPEGMDDLLAVAGARGVPLVRRSAQAVDPMDDAQSWGVNDRSLVLSLETQGGQVLFTGDLEAAGEKAVSGWVQGPISVLKVPHHGSKTSSTPIFLEAVQPALAVISVGRRNRFGHPDPGVLQRYAQANIPIWRTDWHGTIQLRITAATTRVWTHRAGRGWRREEGLGCSPSGPLPLGDPKPHSGDRAGNRQALSNADSLPENRFQDPSS